MGDIIKVFVITILTIALGVSIRGDLAFGGELIIPALAVVWVAIKREEKDNG